MDDLPVCWEAFLECLKVLLEKADMSPAGLAATLHISRSAASQWFL